MCTWGVCVSRCASATNMSPAVRLLSCFAPAPQGLQAMSLAPSPPHHADFCLIHCKRLTCIIQILQQQRPLGAWLGLRPSSLRPGSQAGTIITERGLGFLCKHYQGRRFDFLSMMLLLLFWLSLPRTSIWQGTSSAC